MSYRSEAAQCIHTAIISFIKKQISVMELEQTLAQKYQESRYAFMELSSNGFSHLMDIYHLSYEMINNKSLDDPKNINHEIAVTIKTLHSIIFSIVKDSKIYRFLLLTANKQGFTPLHEVLIAGNPKNLNAYLAQISAAVQQGVLSNKEHKQLLIGANQAGFTPLHQVLKAGNPKNLNTYLAHIGAAIQQGVLSDEEHRRLLIEANQAGFTPLHEVLIQGSLENLKTYLGQLQVLWNTRINDKRVLKTDDFLALLIQTNKAGFTPLHQAAASGHLQSIECFVNFIKNTLVQEEVEDLMKTLLTDRTKANYLASCQKNISGAKQVNNYLDELRKRYVPKAADNSRQYHKFNRGQHSNFFQRHTPYKEENPRSKRKAPQNEEYGPSKNRKSSSNYC